MDTKASILIVDDRPEKMLALEAVLEDLQQTIVRAYSGREALRHILNQDFAVILLDVNMPGMDGFETASLIRQRGNSLHTPIIFVTAFGDELHATRGYSLGAVDYILTPVLPEVLRTKVGVFVELYIKTEQIKRQAESLQRRASQMQKLAAASLAINAAPSIERILQTLTHCGRDIIGAHQAIAIYLAAGTGRAAKIRTAGSFSDKYASWRERDLSVNAVASTLFAHAGSVIRMTEDEVNERAEWEALRSVDIPPIRGESWPPPSLADGATLGVIYLSDRCEGDFTHSDESVLVQLAQMGSIAVENTIYAEERQANRIKDEFLATLSHELRTPLNAILGWTQLLKMENLGEEIAHGVEVIDRNARAQTKLIEDLLDVSRITSGKLRLNRKQVMLGPIVKAALDASRPAADAKQISIDVHLSDESIMAVVDPDRIQQVAWNLLSNAIKFTAAGGKVSVYLDRVGPAGSERVFLRIKDTGQGIDGKFLPFVFDRFRQADSSSTRSQTGLGIGLAIVHHIIEQHGGTVSAQSDGVGRGATFSVEMPGTPAGDIPISKQASGDGSLAWPGSNALSLVDTHILIVDDEADAREVVAATLRRAGAKVATAGSVAEAMRIFETSHPDILVSDIAMPEQDGHVLIRQIRRLSHHDRRDLPAIALTAYAREEDRARALAAGFQVHLAKPVDQPELIKHIAALTADTQSAAVLIPPAL